MSDLRQFYPEATDFMCAVDDKLWKLQEENEHTIQVLGGAVYAAEYAEKNDLQKFMQYLPQVASSASFVRYRGGVAQALREFCHLCMVDPALIEAVVGMRFSEVEAQYQ